MNKTLRAAIVVIVTVLVIIAFLSTTSAMLPKGKKAPDFKLPTLKGKLVSLDEVQRDPADRKKKRVVLLDFWATWCPPCREYVPKLQKIHEDYGKKGLCVAGITVGSEDTKTVEKFVKEKKVTYILLLDNKREVARLYQVTSIPTTYLIDKDGVIRYTHIGYYPGMEKDVEKEIKALLK